MVKADQIVALLQSYGENDETRFLSVAMQIAAHEARQGHQVVAKELRDLIDTVKEKHASVSMSGNPIPIIRPKGELAGLLSASYSKSHLRDMVITSALRERLERILLEHRQREKIQAFHLVPRHKILLMGPPGTGKTLTAKVLAGELHIPLFSIRMENVITKFMGETAAKLRIIFDAIVQTRGVYLFDEFDALGTHRNADNDVGEVRRILNSFLQFMEEECSTSVVVAATNHPSLLDKALFRRFDDILEYSLPDNDTMIDLLTSHLARFDTEGVDWSAIAGKTSGLSHAEVVQVAQDAAKNAILQDKETINTEMILNAVAEKIKGVR